MPTIPDEVIVGVLTDAIAAVGRKLGVATLSLGSKRLKDDLAVIRWFETYKIIDRTSNLPDLIGEPIPEGFEDALRSDSIDALLHELLAVRLTDAPQQDANRVRESWDLTWSQLLPGTQTSDLSSNLFDYYDQEICLLVGRMEGALPDLLPQMRMEGYATRVIATLHAIERHTAALTQQFNPQADAAFIARYRSHAVQHHGKLEPPDFERRRRIPIAEIYVPPSILVAPPKDPKHGSNEIGLMEFAQEIDRTVLLGDPGGGKTTATHVLMHHYGTRTDRPVPFLVTLREFAAQDPPERSVVEHIDHSLNSFYQCPAPSGAVLRLLLSGTAVVIFDGLDELVDTSRRAEVTAIVEQFCLEYPLASVLVTSRLVGYDQARLDDRQFKIFRIGQFNERRIADYVRKWFAQEEGIDIHEAEELSSSFMEESAEVPDLRANPLMLALMCILYRGEGSIPRNRPEVYEQCATLLFRKWDARRRIHVELRARYLVEPALRHLAYWLFTRDQAQPAVTERELITETTGFLHERGFESRDDATDAAREFVEFCKGRAWVFSDAGTTASGQALYTFTHRTFLEYFAAAHLAAICDTPEKLAKALGPHIARQEWDVVAELSIQMKDSVIDRGAERIYTNLLTYHLRRSALGRNNVLEFLAWCLKSVEPSPRLVRELTRAILDHLFTGKPSSPVYYNPMAVLLVSCTTCLETVKDEIDRRIAEMVSSDDLQTRLLGLDLATSIAVGLNHQRSRGNRPSVVQEANRQFWSAYVDSNFRVYRELILGHANCDGLMFGALDRSLLTVNQVIASADNMAPIFLECPTRVFEIRFISYMMMCLYYILGWLSRPESQDLTSSFEALAEVGSYVLANPHPPWAIFQYLEPVGLFYPDNPTSKAGEEISDKTTYLGAAVTLLIFAEAQAHGRTSEEERRSRESPLESPLESMLNQLGPLEGLLPYIKLRLSNVPELDTQASLPDLPIPDEFHETLRDWAKGAVNFTDWQEKA